MKKKENPSIHKQILALALPIMVSNISVPLLGAVDTAVVGHLPEARFLAAVALGTTLLGVLYAGLNFLRMGTAGLTANSFGSQDTEEMLAWLYRGMVTAFMLGGILWLIHKPLAILVFGFMTQDASTANIAQTYFSIRIISAPAALIHFVLLGWLIGMQKTKVALVIQIAMNGLNIFLDILFVVILGYGIEGAASATVVSEILSAILGLYLVKGLIHDFKLKRSHKPLFTKAIVGRLFSINRDLFLRAMGLQGTFMTFTTLGSHQGETTLAANAVLLNFLLFCAYGLDGLANAAESLVGEAIGKGKQAAIRQSILVTLYWSVIMALPFSLVYGVFGEQLVNLLTSVEDVRVSAYQFLPWAVALPLVSVWCYHFDGCFTGATQTTAMRNSMVLSFVLFLLTIYFLLPTYQNHGLWAAFLLFHVYRAFTLVFKLPKLWQNFEGNTSKTHS